MTKVRHWLVSNLFLLNHAAGYCNGWISYSCGQTKRRGHYHYERWVWTTPFQIFSIPHFGGLVLTALKGSISCPALWIPDPIRLVRSVLAITTSITGITSSTVDFAISTDSLGSNWSLDMKDELKVLLNLDFVWRSVELNHSAGQRSVDWEEGWQADLIIVVYQCRQLVR